MNHKTIALFVFVFGVFCGGLSYWYSLTGDNPLPPNAIQKSDSSNQNIVKIQSSESTPDLKMEASLEDKEYVKNLVATTPKEAKEAALSFYKNFFSVSAEDASNAVAGNTVIVYNVDDPNEDPAWFVPIYSTGKVVALATLHFHEQDNGMRQVSTMKNVKNQNWYSYPPLKGFDADQIMLENTIDFTRDIRYFFTKNKSVPYYKYHSNVKLDSFSLISSHNGTLITSQRLNAEKYAREKALSEQQENTTMFLNQDGFVQLKEEKLSELSDLERKKHLFEIALINEHIKSGKVILDNNLEPVRDDRTETDLKNEDQRRQAFYSESRTSENAKLGSLLLEESDPDGIGLSSEPEN